MKSQAPLPPISAVRRRHLLVLAAALLAITAPTLPAASTWNQTGTANWGTPGNWDPNTVPNGTDVEVVVGTGTQTLNLQSNTYTIGKLTTSGSGTTTISTGTLTLNVSSGVPVLDIGKATTISATLSGTQGFKKTGDATLTLSGPNVENHLVIEAANGITQFDLGTKNKNHVITSDIKVDSGATFRGYSMGTGSTATWSGTLTGTGAFSLANGTGSHTLEMDASGFSGNFSITGGSIAALVGKDDAFGAGSTLSTGGIGNRILSNSNADRILHTSLSNTSTLAFGDSVNYSSNTGKLTFTGGLFLSNSVDVATAVDGIVVEIQGAVTRSLATPKNWTKLGSGTLILSGSNVSDPSNYAKHTIVSAGTMLINGKIFTPTTGAGTMNFTVQADAILGGTGMIDGRPLTIEADGILAPGDSTAADTTGTLTINSDVTFAQDAIFRVELNSDTKYDSLTLGNTFVLTLTSGAVLDLQLDPVFTFVEGKAFTIVSGFNSLSGQFAGLADGANFTESGVDFRINYNPNSIVLTVVPEPSVALLVGLGMASLLLRRRHRRS